MINRPKVSSLLPKQVPEFVREDYATFIDFLKAYYEFLDQNYDPEITKLRDLDTTLDSFIDQFKNELAHNVPYTVVNERFLLEKIKDQYLAKGSEASFKLLFKLLFNKNVVVDYPSKQILRASDGRWNQDVSVFVYVNAGDPADIVGKIVDVVTPTRVIRVQVDKRQYVELEIDNIVQISEHIYELFIDRRFFGDINPGDKVRYSDIFDATILSTTSLVVVQRKGKNFKVGELYEVKSGLGKGSIVKVARVNETGGIEAMEFVRYGIGYVNDFTAALVPYNSLSNLTPGATSLTISGASPSLTIGLAETTNGFFEFGTINRSDYNNQTEAEALDEGVGNAWDGTYVGEIVREFYADNKGTIVDADEPAIIKVILGASTKYPGYYSTNDGFLDDAIFIQDSRYYQAFAYVIKIDERLEKYRSAVKTLIHPAGMALFGEFDIRNEFDLGPSLEFAIKYLFISLQDEVQTEDTSFLKLIHMTWVKEDDELFPTEEYTSLLNKPLGTQKLNDGTTSDINVVTPSEAISSKGVGKLVNSSKLYDGTTLDNNTVTTSEDTIDYGYSSYTRTGISVVDSTKFLNSNQYPHKLYDNTTLDNDNFTLADTTGSGGARTVPYFVLNKDVSTHYLNSTWTQWTINNTVTAGSIYQFGNYVYTATVSGITGIIPPSHTSGSEPNGTAIFEYLGVYNEIADTNSVTLTETEFVLAVLLNKTLGTHTLNDEVTPDTSSVTMTGSGGSLWLNPYTNPYPITDSYFANDSGNYTTGESAFTG